MLKSKTAKFFLVATLLLTAATIIYQPQIEAYLRSHRPRPELELAGKKFIVCWGGFSGPANNRFFKKIEFSPEGEMIATDQLRVGSVVYKQFEVLPQTDVEKLTGQYTFIEITGLPNYTDTRIYLQ